MPNQRFGLRSHLSLSHIVYTEAKVAKSEFAIVVRKHIYQGSLSASGVLYSTSFWHSKQTLKVEKRQITKLRTVKN